MSTKQAVLIGLLLTAAALLYSALLYQKLPAVVPVHWDINGHIDGWGSKTLTLWLMPGFMLLLLGMTIALPAISPREFKVSNFQSTFNYVMVISIALMGYSHFVLLQATLHGGTDLGRALFGGIFIFFALIGNVMGKTRRNFWMGVRTPWTLASDQVWIATHRLAARLFVAVGIIGAIATWLGAPILLCLALLLIASFYPILYSYLIYRRLPQNHAE